MRISRLFLTDFRNYSKKSFEFGGETTLIVGPNASGKTNILEAIYAVATGDSWRTQNPKDMVRLGAEAGHIIGNIKENGGDVGLRLTLTGGTVNGKRAAAVLYKVDEVARRRADFVGRLKVVLFEPESLDIVIGDPSQRRRFLDECLSQTDREYVRSLQSYGKALRVRNKLLDAIREGRAKEETLEFWERTLVKHGNLIQNSRQLLVEWFNGQLPATKGATLRSSTLEVNYSSNIISADRLEQYRDREILAGFTFVGPQRDDFVVAQIINQKSAMPAGRQEIRNLSQYGSRGEQRMAVLRLKLLEAKWIEDQSGETPVLLLDDIFSELDSEHEKAVGELAAGRQTVMTATEIHKGHYPEAKIVELK